MKPVRKAVFPVAGLGTRMLPAAKTVAKAAPARQLAVNASSSKMGQARAPPAADNGDWESF